MESRLWIQGLWRHLVSTRWAKQGVAGICSWLGQGGPVAVSSCLAPSHPSFRVTSLSDYGFWVQSTVFCAFLAFKKWNERPREKASGWMIDTVKYFEPNPLTKEFKFQKNLFASDWGKTSWYLDRDPNSPTPFTARSLCESFNFNECKIIWRNSEDRRLPTVPR